MSLSKRPRAIIIAWLYALTFLPLTFSCGGGDDPTDPTDLISTEAPDTATISITGGTANLKGGVRVSIPNGALSQAITVSLTVKQSDPTVTDGQRMGLIFALGPDGTQFNSPVEIRLPYPESFSGAPTELLLFTNSLQGDLEALTSPQSTAGQYVSGRTTHFSPFWVSRRGLESASITVSREVVSLEAGETLQLGATVRNAAGGEIMDPEVDWTSVDTTVATINSKGTLNGKKVGSTTVVATAGTAADTVQVTVTQTVSTVTVTPTTATLESIGETVQLTAAVKDAYGNAVEGTTANWTSSTPGIAAVSGTGLVTAVANGTTQIIATAGTKTDTVNITVSQKAASVTLTPESADLTLIGDTATFKAAATDARANDINDATFTWSVSNGAAVTLVAGNADSARVVAKGNGTSSLTVQATRGDGTVADTSTVTVQAQVASVTITPVYAQVDAGGTTKFTVTAQDAGGNAFANPTVNFALTQAGVATVDSSGTATGVGVGQTSIIAQVAAAADTAALVVLDANSILSTAFAGGSYETQVTPGQVITVPVTFDMSRVSANGDLGTAVFELTFDPSVLQYDAVETQVAGLGIENLTSGKLTWAVVSTAPQGSPDLVLAIVTFTVKSGAPVGSTATLGLAFTEQPANTSYTEYSGSLVAVGGRLLVRSP